MKRLNNILAILTIGLMITGCGDGQSEKSTNEDQSAREKAQQDDQQQTTLKHDPINTDTLDLALNEGRKWEIDSLTKAQMLKISNLIKEKGRNLRKLKEGQFDKLKADIENAIQKMEAHDSLKGPAKEKFQTLLNLIKQETKILGQGKKKGQVALVNLSELMKVYREHFE